MISDSIMEAARGFAYRQLGGDSGGHDWWHVSRVATLARKIAESEGADPDFCEFVGLLHDIPDEKRRISREEGFAALTGWLESLELSRDFIEEVLDIISTMSFRGGTNPPMKTLEGKVVQDADRLDAIGAIGIARTFAYSGQKGQLIYDPDIPVRENLTLKQYRNGKSTAVNHFHEKLLKLGELMNTDYAREMSKERLNFMKLYLEQFMSEWES